MTNQSKKKKKILRISITSILAFIYALSVEGPFTTLSDIFTVSSWASFELKSLLSIVLTTIITTFFINLAIGFFFSDDD